MEFLLILSALLSAVTGAISGARGPETGIHQTEAASRLQQVPSAVEQQVVRPAARPSDEAAPSHEIRAPRDFALAASVPAYRDRPLE